MCVCASVSLGLGVNTPGSLSFSQPAITMTTSWHPAHPPHTADISLPSPSHMFVSLTPSPRSPPPPLSVIYLYFILSTFISTPVSPTLALPSPSLPLSSFPVMSTCYPYIKELRLLHCVSAKTLLFALLSLSLSLSLSSFNFFSLSSAPCWLSLTSSYLKLRNSLLLSPWTPLPHPSLPPSL